MITLLEGDCRVTLRTLPERSVQTCITSPPYYSLRDYSTEPLEWGGDPGHTHEWGPLILGRKAQTHNGLTAAAERADGHPRAPSSREIGEVAFDTIQGAYCPCGAWLGSLGLEPTPELWIEHLVEIFREVRRVLRDDATVWLNLGDSYASNPASGGERIARPFDKNPGPHQQTPNNGWTRPPGYKPKDLMLLPARVAIALQQDGWYVRSQIPWLKRNSMPESVTDRPANAVEYVFLLSKSSRYFFDADAVRVAASGGRWGPDDERTARNGWGNGELAVNARFGGNGVSRSRRNSDWFFESWQGLLLDEQDDPLALVVNPAPFKESHFATFPPKLIEPMVKAGTSEKGQCPECGAPWARVTQETPEYADFKSAMKAKHPNKTWTREGDRGERGHNPVSVPAKNATTGWQPTCAHTDAEPVPPPVPQTVLDIFGGSGTVGLVADRLGRNAILCELNPKYADMGAARVTGDAPMFVELER